MLQFTYKASSLKTQAAQCLDEMILCDFMQEGKSDNEAFS